MAADLHDKERKAQFNIYLPEALVRIVKHAAVDESQSLSAFVETALLHYLAHLRVDVEPSRPRSRKTVAAVARTRSRG